MLSLVTHTLDSAPNVCITRLALLVGNVSLAFMEMRQEVLKMIASRVPVLYPSLLITSPRPVVMSRTANMVTSVWSVRQDIQATDANDVMTDIMATLWFREGFAFPVTADQILTELFLTFVTI